MDKQASESYIVIDVWTCEHCGAINSSNNPYKGFKSEREALNWYSLHSSLPHKIKYNRNDCLRMVDWK